VECELDKWEGERSRLHDFRTRAVWCHGAKASAALQAGAAAMVAAAAAAAATPRSAIICLFFVSFSRRFCFLNKRVMTNATSCDNVGKILKYNGMEK